MRLNDELKQIISNSTFEIIPGRFVYAKVRAVPNTSNHFMVARDNDEITVVTEEPRLDELELIERNRDTYSLIAVNVSIPFYSVGFLAVISGAIAEAGLNILIVSTYSKDYILIKFEQTDKARERLISLGFKIKLHS